MIKKKRHVTKFPNQVIQSRMELGNSLAVQWLGLCTSLQRAQVQSLVEELRSRKPQGAPPPQKKGWSEIQEPWGTLCKVDSEVRRNKLNPNLSTYYVTLNKCLF